MKRIVLPTDFSENARNAINYAIRLFKGTECTFYLLHTYIPAIYQSEYVLHSPGQIGFGDIYQEESMSRLNELKERFEQKFKNPKHTFLTHSAFNLLVDEIERIIENENIDLVIMGTQGATGAKEIFLGTHAVQVIKKAQCPVIVVPSKFKYEAPKEILFPTDYEIAYQKEQLRQLSEIAETHVSNIEVIHVSEGYELRKHQKKNKEFLAILLGNIAHQFHNLPNQGVIQSINDFQIKRKMNLLVMIQNKHTFLERLFIQPIIKKIGFHVTIPFMVIPHFEEN